MHLFARPRRLVACAAISFVALATTLPARISAQGSPTLIISEVHPSGSSNVAYGADWFEITNIGSAPANISGWRIDDSSNAFATAATLRGVVSIPAGKSALFFEGLADGSTDEVIKANLSNAWFGSPTPPPGVQIGAYGGAGLGLSGSGDAVNLFDATGAIITNVSFGAATLGRTFDNAAGIGGMTISTLSTAGVNGAFTAGGETGSPGRIANPPSFSTIDLATYVRVGRFPLPEPTSVPAPPGNLLAQEASAVAYNWDTDTLFITGDGGLAIVQVTKTGQLIDSMTLAPGTSPQGTDFYDPEGLTYVGNGRFVMSEERDRQAVLFTYAPNTTLTRGNASTVKLGTFAPNIGNEGLSYDPLTGGFIVVKETQPQGIFQTLIDFAGGTASNGSPATENPINLFNPSVMNLLDIADVFALSNLPTISGPGAANLLVLSQESGRIVNVDRQGNITSSLTILPDPSSLLTVADMQHEGLTMDGDGILYVVNENGGGNIDRPELWVYAPSTVPNQAPTALALINQQAAIAENTTIAPRRKVADVAITDDGLGINNLTLSGADAASFEIDITGLYLKAGTNLDFETKASFSVSVAVDDPTLGASPDATATFTLAVTDVVEVPSTPPSVAITEVAPWGSGATPYGADWFELTNTGPLPLNLNGWKMDDDSGVLANARTLNGVSSIAPGESVIFMETANLNATATFRTTWFGPGGSPGLQVGTYSGAGVGLSTGGDMVHIFDGGGNLVAKVTFGLSTSGRSFDNSAAINHAAITQLSSVGINGAFASIGAAPGFATEIGSPGGITGPAMLIISEVAPWSSGNSPVGADWFEVTNIGGSAANITGWKIDDSSESPAGAAVLNGITAIAPGESVIFIETANRPAAAAAFVNTWFNGNTPAGLQIGSYTGSGLGLSTGGDAVNLYNQFNVLRARVFFGASSSTTPIATFDNAAGVSFAGISLFSAAGINGGFVAAAAPEVGSPGTIFADTIPPTITFSGNAGAYTVDQGVSIQCSARDASGIASTTCAAISGPAWSFAIGANTFTATATDVAGNVGTASTTFTVTVSPAALQSLVHTFSTSAGVTSGLNAKLAAAAKSSNPNARAGQLGAFENQVNAQTGKALTAEQAAVLIRLSRYLL